MSTGLQQTQRSQRDWFPEVRCDPDLYEDPRCDVPGIRRLWSSVLWRPQPAALRANRLTRDHLMSSAYVRVA